MEAHALFLLLLGMVNTAYRKTSLHRDRPNLEPAVQRARSHGIGLAQRGASTALRKPMPRDDADECPAPRAYPFFTMSRNPPLGQRQNCCLFEFGRFPLEVWWSQTGSNRRPPACKAGALPTELWPRLDLTATFQAISREDPATEHWWAWKDLNFRPHAYQARALTN